MTEAEFLALFTSARGKPAPTSQTSAPCRLRLYVALFDPYTNAKPVILTKARIHKLKIIPKIIRSFAARGLSAKYTLRSKVTFAQGRNAS